MNNRLQELLNLYLSDRATAQEKDELWDYTDDPLYKNDLQELLSQVYHQEHTGKALSIEQRQTVLEHIFASDEIETIESPVKFRLWPRMFAAAASAAVIILGIWLYSNKMIPALSHDKVSYKNDIAPGRSMATLTLANGTTIKLSDTKRGFAIDGTKLTYDDGSLINPSLQSGKISRNEVEMETPKGGMYEVMLSDGTRVWLNADSKLKFPAQFSGNSRSVVLNGEAYFEVAKDKTRPFIVESKGQKVEVLGTHFNINSYADERSVKTTLLEGSVRVTYASQIASHNGVVLKPNQQSTLTSSSRINIKQVDVNDVMDWKNGDFIFKEESLGSLMQRVSRWYNVNLTYDQDVNKAKTFTGKVSRSKNISVILKAISNAGQIRFSIEGNTVIVKN